MSWIKFEEAGKSGSGLTAIWNVMPVDGTMVIGEVRWFGPWRAYAFWPESRSAYFEKELDEIAQFCKQATAEHRDRKAAGVCMEK